MTIKKKHLHRKLNRIIFKIECLTENHRNATYAPEHSIEPGDVPS